MRKLLFIILTVIPTLLVAQKAPSSELLDKIMSENKRIKSIECPFTHTKYLPFMSENIISKGMFYYDINGKVCMDYIEPAGELLLINGDLFKMVANGKERKMNAQSKSKAGELSNLLFACFQGNLSGLNDCKITYEETADLYIMTVVMLKKSKMLPEILVLEYNKKDYSIERMKMEEDDGSFSLYELKGKKINTDITKDKFGK